jgi:hypothetical protein
MSEDELGDAVGMLGLGCGLELLFWGYVVLCIFFPPALLGIPIVIGILWFSARQNARDEADVTLRVAQLEIEAERLELERQRLELEEARAEREEDAKWQNREWDDE